MEGSKIIIFFTILLCLSEEAFTRLYNTKETPLQLRSYGPWKSAAIRKRADEFRPHPKQTFDGQGDIIAYASRRKDIYTKRSDDLPSYGIRRSDEEMPSYDPFYFNKHTPAFHFKRINSAEEESLRINLLPIEDTIDISEDSAENSVLDFSSGTGKVVESTVLNPEVIEENALLEIGSETFSQFLKAIEIVKAEEALQQLESDKIDKITVFAPTDSAFEEANLPIDSMTPRELFPIILQHVVINGSFPASALKNRKLMNANNQELETTIENGKIFISSSTSKGQIVVADIQTKLGLIHGIDTVL